MKVADILATHVATPYELAYSILQQLKAGEPVATGLCPLPDLSDRFPVSRRRADVA